jgi:hypothetical protein
MLKMTEQDATAPMKKPRSEAQVASLEKAWAKARELRTQRNVIREKHGITDETDATPDETPTDDAETENTETESDTASENEDEEPKPAAAVVEKKPKPVKKEKPKTDLAPKPKRQATPYQPQQRDEHVPVPQNFRMMSRNQYILFEE